MLKNVKITVDCEGLLYEISGHSLIVDIIENENITKLLHDGPANFYVSIDPPEICLKLRLNEFDETSKNVIKLIEDNKKIW